MAPQPVSDPERRFVLTRLLNGVETNVRVSPLLPLNYTSDQTVRINALVNSRQFKALSNDYTYLLYGPSNGGPHTDGDCIWRSDIDYGDEP